MKLRDLLTLRPGVADPASRFLDRITDEIADGPLNLPCFPDVVLRVRAALDDPASTADDIVKIAGSEPRLAARLLQTAGSVVFNPTGKPVPNLRVAVTRLGHNLVRSVAMVFAIQQARADPLLRGVARPLADLWEKSVAVASICQVLAEQIKVPTDKVFLAGLVHGIGHFYVIVRSAEPGSGIAYEDLPTDLVAERHPSIGRAVLAKWGFETVVCEAVAHHRDHARQTHRAADITDVLVASVVLAEALREDGGSLGRCEGITAFERLGLGPDELRAVLVHTGHAVDSLRASLAS
ncbi:MAG: HDOD domain-containing protein [Steroidobacteraceae bacterium]|jgi:HD-like signal output (HDOD) protein|nr:HDOD domain-containing protein [Steroidobacteraceae bacterium]